MKTFDREITACFTGHRILKKNFNRAAVAEMIERLYKRGYRFFLDGMALGFDTVAMNLLLEAKRVHPDIIIVACLPCSDQAAKFRPRDKQEYERLCALADLTVVVRDGPYTDECMMERNRFMVDNSSAVISYVYKRASGSYATVRYAEQCELDIYPVCSDEDDISSPPLV